MRELDGKFCIKEDGKHGRESRYNIGQDNSRVNVISRFKASKGKYTSAYDGTNVKPNKIPPVQSFFILS